MMALQWYLLGMMTVMAVLGYQKLTLAYRLGWQAKGVLAASALLLALCFGWSWASFAEGEAQSGAMGLVIFGLGGVLILAAGWRRWIAPFPR